MAMILDMLVKLMGYLISILLFYKMSMLYIHVQNIYCNFHLF